jgi:pimeloyl-ACP methyl ester carboxylesterase
VPPISDPALLLHGQPGNARDWDPVQDALAGRIDAVAINRPGWDRRSRPVDLAENARAAVAALDARRLERAIIVGHSLGAAVAAQLAIEFPERVASLVLVAPSATCGSLNRLDELLAAPVLGSALTTGAFAGVGLALRVGPLRHRIATRFGIGDAYLRRYARVMLDPLSWHAFVVEQRMLFRDLPGLEARLGEITAPTTIVIGTADRIVTPASAARLAGAIPSAGLVRVDRATHLLPQERPVELADVIVNAAGEPEADQDSPGSG